jgi:glycosyltransferase involved in cell wall biosynthesis
VQFADITFVILTKNEAANIEACLGSLPARARALVYDAQSDDDTIQRARALGAHVITQPWAGFRMARARAAAAVTTGWTFMLDADERIPADLASELAKLEPAAEVDAYSVARRNWFCGRWVKSAGWWPDRLVRLFRTGRASVAARAGREEDVHEIWLPQGGCQPLQSPLDHFSYHSIEEYRRKFARYTDLEAQAARAGLLMVMAAWLTLPLRAAWYVLGRGGWRDGWRGLFVCAASALYPVAVATKAWALERARDRRPSS